MWRQCALDGCARLWRTWGPRRNTSPRMIRNWLFRCSITSFQKLQHWPTFPAWEGREEFQAQENWLSTGFRCSFHTGFLGMNCMCSVCFTPGASLRPAGSPLNRPRFPVPSDTPPPGTPIQPDDPGLASTCARSVRCGQRPGPRRPRFSGTGSLPSGPSRRR